MNIQIEYKKCKYCKTEGLVTKNQTTCWKCERKNALIVKK